MNCRALEKLHGVITTWAEENGLAFAPDKYRVMHFEPPFKKKREVENRDGYEENGRCVLRPRIEGLGPKAIPSAAEPYMDILGVRIHYKMEWASHVDTVSVCLICASEH